MTCPPAKFMNELCSCIERFITFSLHDFTFGQSNNGQSAFKIQLEHDLPHLGAEVRTTVQYGDGVLVHGVINIVVHNVQ